MEPAESPKPPAAEVRPAERQDVQRLTRTTVLRLESALQQGALEPVGLPESAHATLQSALRDPAVQQALRSFRLVPHLRPEVRWSDEAGAALFIEGKEVATARTSWPGDIVQMLRRGLVTAAMTRPEENAQIALNRSQLQTEALGTLQAFDTLKGNRQQADAVLHTLAETLGLKEDIDVLTVPGAAGASTALIVERQTLVPLAYIELTPVRLIAGMNTTRPSVSASTLTLNPALSSLPHAALLRLLCARAQADSAGARVERTAEGYVLTYKDAQGTAIAKTFRE